MGLRRRAASSAARRSGRSPRIEISNISVRTSDGAVLLSGTVPDRAKIEKAGEAVMSVVGISAEQTNRKTRIRGQRKDE
ncbi:BON domain-containing protein [Burkholderia cepacia]|uniref:BON domain-containing protein n=1 Tax=Burkholderia cepacia TaxID=292 RepID=UPI0018B071BA